MIVYILQQSPPQRLNNDVLAVSLIENTPKFATGVGLIKYGSRNMHKGKSKFTIRDKNIYDKVRGSMRSWIRDLF